MMTGPSPSFATWSLGSTPGTSLAVVTSTAMAASGLICWAATRAPFSPTSSWTATTRYTVGSNPSISLNAFINTATPTLSSKALPVTLSPSSIMASRSRSTGLPTRIPARSTSPRLDAPMSTKSLSSGTTWFLSSGFMRCGGFIPMTPRTMWPSSVSIRTLWPGRTRSLQPPTGER